MSDEGQRFKIRVFADGTVKSEDKAGLLSCINAGRNDVVDGLSVMIRHLCEQDGIVLRPWQLYAFVPSDSCEKCARILDVFKESP